MAETQVNKLRVRTRDQGAKVSRAVSPFRGAAAAAAAASTRCDIWTCFIKISPRHHNKGLF